MAQENKYQGVATVGWTSSFNPLKKGPVIAKRIWDTYAEMEAYVKRASDSAVPGLILTVTKDENIYNNGAYLIESIEGFDGGTKTSLVKMSTGAQTTVISDLAADTPEEVAQLENGILHIKDMRSKWETGSF